MSGVVEEREPTKHVEDGCRSANEDSEARELLATNGDTIGVVLTAMLAENDISYAMFRDDPRGPGSSGIWQSYVEQQKRKLTQRVHEVAKAFDDGKGHIEADHIPEVMSRVGLSLPNDCEMRYLAAICLARGMRYPFGGGGTMTLESAIRVVQLNERGRQGCARAADIMDDQIAERGPLDSSALLISELVRELVEALLVDGVVQAHVLALVEQEAANDKHLQLGGATTLPKAKGLKLLESDQASATPPTPCLRAAAGTGPGPRPPTHLPAGAPPDRRSDSCGWRSSV